MLLLVGLGNPGAQYARHRHNAGFMAVDAIHRRHGFPGWRRRFSSDIAEAQLGGDKCLLLKPQVFMNLSGRAVQEASHFYKLDPSDILVVHDEVDLPPGKIRMKAGGGAAGHNGLRSIAGAIGEDFRRLRIGVGHPGVKEAVPNYVLHDFARNDATWLLPLLDAIADNAGLLVDRQDQTFANRIHEAIGKQEAKPKAPRPPPEPPRDESRSAPVAGPAEHEGILARGLRKLFGR
jgi:PTH1 family peptidyl-tRNA hydrolase